MVEKTSHNTIWQVVDRLRGNLSLKSNEFSVALSTLIFLRWADFREAEQEAIAQFEGNDYQRVLQLSHQWRSWCELSPIELAGVLRKLPTVLRTSCESRHDPFAMHLQRMSPAVELLAQLKPDELAILTDWVAAQAFDTPRDRRSLLEKIDGVLAKSTSRTAGEYSTPPAVGQLMVELAAPKAGESVYDPCFGVAGLLTASLDYVQERNGQPLLNITGVEINPTTYVIGLTRLILAGSENHQLELGNSLEQVPLNNPQDGSFDVVLANPPFGAKVKGDGLSHFPIRTSDTTNLFIQHALAQLRPNGRAVLAVPHGVLFRGGSDRRLREMLLKENRVDAVIDLPSETFMPYTSIRTSLLMLRRSGSTESVRMVDANSLIERSEKRAPAKLDIAGFRELASRLRNPDHTDENMWDVDVKAIAEVEYDLTPKRRDRSELSLILDSLHQTDVEVKTLRECCQVMRGKTISSKKLIERQPLAERESIVLESDELEFDDAPIAYIRIKDIQRGQVKRSSTWLKPTVASNHDPKKKLHAGDVLVSKSGTIGKAGIFPGGVGEAIAAGGLYVLRAEEDIFDPRFLLAYLQSKEVQSWLDDRARGSGIRHISQEVFKNLPVPRPPLQVQKRIANQHRDFQVDALQYLAELYSETQDDPLASGLLGWVSHCQQTIDDAESVEHLSPEAMLEAINEIAFLEDACEISKCQECGQPYFWGFDNNRRYEPDGWSEETNCNTTCRACWLGVGPGSDTIESLTERSSLVPWAFAFREALLNLKDINRITQDVGLFAVLQTARSQLDSSLEKLAGHLPNANRARRLTEELCALVDLHVQYLLSTIRLHTNTFAVEHEDGVVEVELSITNDSLLPIRDIRFSSDLDEYGFLGVAYYLRTDEDAGFNFQNVEHSPNEPLTFNLSWTGKNLKGDSFEGSKEVSVEVLRKKTEAPIPLGPSPYVTGVALKSERDDVFFGREKLLGQIHRQISQSGNVVLLQGIRRAGKSSILWRLEGKDAVPGWLGVFFDLQRCDRSPIGGIPTAEFFRTLTVVIARSLVQLNGTVTLPDGSLFDANTKGSIRRFARNGISAEAPFSDFLEFVEQVLKELEKKDLRLLLMFDEFDLLQEGIENGVTSSQVPENIRFLLQNHPNISAVVTGTRRLKHMREKYYSALFGLGRSSDVSALPFEAASRLITEPVEDHLTFSRSAVQLAYSLTAGQPYLLQCLCSRIFDLAAESGVRSITTDDVNTAASALVEDNEHFAELWNYMEYDRRRFLLYLLHKGQSEQLPLRINVIVSKLEQAGVNVEEGIVMSDLEYFRELELVDLRHSAAGVHYTLKIPLMGKWMEIHHDLEVLRLRALQESEDIPSQKTEWIPPPDYHQEWLNQLKDVEFDDE